MKRLLASALALLVLLITCNSNSSDDFPTKPYKNHLPKKEFDCLVRNIYYEARGESFMGQVTVGAVTLNRVKHPAFAKTVCGVVYEKGQFSWTKDTALGKPNAKAWEACKEAAIAAQYNPQINALYFHNLTVKPKWSKNKGYRLGNHIFYPH